MSNIYLAQSCSRGSPRDITQSDFLLHHWESCLLRQCRSHDHFILNEVGPASALARWYLLIDAHAGVSEWTKCLQQQNEILGDVKEGRFWLSDSSSMHGALDSLGLKRYCCWCTLMTHVDLVMVEKLLNCNMHLRLMRHLPCDSTNFNVLAIWPILRVCKALALNSKVIAVVLLVSSVFQQCITVIGKGCMVHTALQMSVFKMCHISHKTTMQAGGT